MCARARVLEDMSGVESLFARGWYLVLAIDLLSDGSLEDGHAFGVVFLLGVVQRCLAILHHELDVGAVVRSGQSPCGRRGGVAWGLSVRGGSAVSRWVDPACPLMATYHALDIELGPCLDQQVHAAVVAIFCGTDERRVAMLQDEWARGSTEVMAITAWEERGVARWMSVRGGSAVSR